MLREAQRGEPAASPGLQGNLRHLPGEIRQRSRTYVRYNKETNKERGRPGERFQVLSMVTLGAWTAPATAIGTRSLTTLGLIMIIYIERAA